MKLNPDSRQKLPEMCSKTIQEQKNNLFISAFILLFTINIDSGGYLNYFFSPAWPFIWASWKNEYAFLTTCVVFLLFTKYEVFALPLGHFLLFRSSSFFPFFPTNSH